MKRNVDISFDPTRVALAKQEADDDTAELGRFTIATPTDLQFANEWLHHTRAQWAELDAMRKKIVDPLNVAKNEVQALFNPALHALAAVEQRLRGAIGAYQLAEQKREREAYREVATALAAAPVAEVTAALAVAQAAAPAKLAGTSVRAVWVAKRVIMDLLPEAYKMPNMVAIEAELAKHSPDGEQPVIPGVVIELDAKLRVSGRQ